MMVRVQLGSGCYFEHRPDPPKTYEYRSLPCTAGDWSVCGFDSLLNGGGVLEWCFDQKDAEERIKIMRAYPQFQDLSIDDGRGSQGAVSEHLLRQIDKGQKLKNVRR